ncbi:MAG: DUF4136 domain-containing protein [Vicinamibacteria bacterium]
MKKSALLAILVATALAAPGRAAAQELRMPKVDLDYDKEVDFSLFRTFAWKPNASSAPTTAGQTRIAWYVERELEKKGLKKAAEGAAADVLVRYYAKREESLKGTPSQTESRVPGGSGSLTTSVDFSKVTGATLLLEIQRASDAKAVWRAESEYKSVDTKRIDAETASAVRRLLAKYPPPKAESAPPAP